MASNDKLEELKQLQQAWKQAEAEASKLNTKEATEKAAKALRVYLAAYKLWRF